VMVATKPVDFRNGAEALAALVREEMNHNIKDCCIVCRHPGSARRWVRHIAPDL
jgi:hypothetical protein